MSYVVAVDSGGTFTDCVILDELGAIARAKAQSTPPRFEEGVLAAVSEGAGRLGLSLEGLLADAIVFAHGTTVATNILITRTGAKTALLTTRGHEDAILIGRTVQKVAGLSEAEIIDVAHLAKADPLRQGTVLYVTAEVIRQIGILCIPFMPSAAPRLLDQLGVPLDERTFSHLGGTRRIAPGRALPAPSAVFPRYIDSEASAQA